MTETQQKGSGRFFNVLRNGNECNYSFSKNSGAPFLGQALCWSEEKYQDTVPAYISV